ncbi:high mobility group B protein 10 isoform X1 [Daucus carota subsp. sativus]|uniref:high mobility group B protein 10 isoform X1 n=1 Tax=Daucus carota subsp. sativus TaxID=79200 RepID=UPI0007B2ED78|nr:PREDICTED: high mobility group B protein 10-like isoform X1 [Daucus carota subsp. sativus]
MQAAEAEMNGADSNAFPIAGPSNNLNLSSSPSREEDFYDKLTKFYQTSGLSLIFDFRETKVNLYRFYKDVIDRGGYCQVSKDGLWDEVASSLNADSSVLVPPNQIQMLYANLFYQFEQTYYYRSPSKVKEAQLLKAALTGQSFSSGKKSGGLTKKRKHSEGNDDSLVEKRASVQSPAHLPTGPAHLPTEIKSVERNSPLQVPTEETGVVLKTPTKAKETKKAYMKEMKKHSNAPVGFRTGYMIFLKMECERLKMIHGEDSAGQYRDMANEAWRRLSESARKPYIEASKRDKERYTREMAEFKIVYDQIAETQNVVTTNPNLVIDFAKPSLPSLQTDGDYHVSLPDDAYHVALPSDAGDTVTNEQLAAEIVQNSASTDPEFQLNWDGYT